MKGEPPLVSVVVPSFNQGRFIREALDSILNQTYPAIEVLVMDGGSTDGTVDILASYGDRIRFWSEPDSGQSDALNRGFEKADGQILGWLNSDDRFCPGAVAKAVAALEEDPEAGFVYGEGELIAEDGHLLRRFPATQPFDLWTLTRVSDFIMQPSVFMRAEALWEAGPLDTSLHFGMDWDLWIRMASHRPVVYLAEVLAQTREYPSAKTASGGFTRWRELRTILHRHGAGRWPPAAITYGLDTLRRKWPVVFGPSSAGDIEALKDHPVARLFAPVHNVVARWIDRVLHSAQGISIDRWTAKRSHLAIPWSGQDAELWVLGEVPAPPDHFPLQIEVRTGGAHQSVEVTEWGRFEVKMPLSGDGLGPRPLEIEMQASHTFCAENDPRRLAFRIEEARMKDAGRTWVVRPYADALA